MDKIEKMLDPDERIVRSQTQVQLSSSVGMPYGTLYLTNKRLIFQVSRGWSLVSTVPAGALSGKDAVIPLDTVRNVKKGWPSVLNVQADKKYDFMIPSLKADEWVDAVLAASSLSPPPDFRSSPQPSQQAQASQSQSSSSSQPPTQRYCGNCGSPLKPGNKFCVSCGSPIQ